MRLFAALVPPTSVLDHLEEVVAPLRDDALRWTAVPDWHLTLAFYGDVDAAQLPNLTARLSRAAARHSPMELALTGAGRFGKQAMWVGCTGEIVSLRRVSQGAISAGRRAGADVADKRRFKPHVTLARAYRNRSVDLRPYVAAMAEYAGPAWTGREVRLIQSHLGAGRPRYETLAEYAL